MGRISSTLTAVCAATLLTATVAAAQGTVADRKTIVTFSGPVSIPGTTLPAGTYVFRLADSPANRHIVQVFDRDEAKIIATLLAVPAARPEPEGDPVVAFKETPSDRPPAVRYWYYAGEKDGNEFIYPKAQAMLIASASGESVSAFDTDSADLDAWKKGSVTKVSPSSTTASTASSTTASTASTTTASTASTTTASTASSTTAEPPPTTSASTASTTTAPTTTASTTTAPTTTAATTTAATTTAPVTPEPAPAPVTTAPTPEPAPTPMIATPPSQPEPVGTSGRTELPRTASELPAVGLVGLLALAAAFGVRAMRRSIA